MCNIEQDLLEVKNAIEDVSAYVTTVAIKKIFSAKDYDVIEIILEDIMEFQEVILKYAGMGKGYEEVKKNSDKLVDKLEDIYRKYGKVLIVMNTLGIMGKNILYKRASFRDRLKYNFRGSMEDLFSASNIAGFKEQYKHVEGTKKEFEYVDDNCDDGYYEDNSDEYDDYDFNVDEYMLENGYDPEYDSISDMYNLD